jgi:hypothetical protein
VAKGRKKPLDAVEEHARAIIARHLAVHVEQHDDNSDDSMPDLRIEYPDGEYGLVEVVRDVERHDPPQGVNGVPPTGFSKVSESPAPETR